MKNLLLFLFCFCYITCKADLWTPKTSYPVSTSWSIFFSLEGKGYVGAGQAFAIHKDFWEFNPVNNIWTQKADYGGGLMWCGCSFSIAGMGKGYAGLGYDTASKLRRDFWEYDPLSNVWTPKANFPGTGKINSVFFSTATMGFVGMGFDSAMVEHNDLWQYNPVADAWTQKLSLPSLLTRSESGSFVIDSIAYIVGGTSTITLSYLNEVWAYNIVTNTWMQKNDYLFTARSSGVAFTLCNKGYLGTGDDGNGLIYLNDFWEYDPVTDVWTQKTSFPGIGREAASFFTINEKAYVGTGIDHNYIFTDFYEYTPDNYCLSGLNNLYPENIFNVFQNPAMEMLFVRIHSSTPLNNLTLRILDLDGKVCINKYFSKAHSEVTATTTNLSTGIYLVELKSDDVNYTKKFMIQ